MKGIYCKIVGEIDSKINPVGVVCSMRLHYGTLDHLPRKAFAEEVEIARECEKQEPGFLQGCANSYGRAGEFHDWEKQNA